ncbi:glutathione S-transferase C-terminal domain-containing protein [Cyanobacterium aponinum AL20118]|uniref:Glutathione S-transferase C-terminal domain-containing protein n=1 Tax=Cyanobacterium aponinum AL20115 TaxID=3090662 RepID=A0AAF1C1H2_9CHRO|nr:glutathione S-transferase C-terminal domain-containing protein [Cyanobacterium aponinum]WPF87653.1 glutathione S-transferase C-terminal domain-containing protein [Cyanobacterium aponinum AL20115]
MTDLKNKSTSLPQSWLIVTGKWVWHTLWRIMMSQLAPTEKQGNYQRPSSQFRHQVKSEVNYLYQPEKGRYRLYVGMSCPWAHRTLIVRSLKGLEDVIDIEILIPSVNQGGWIMETESENCRTLAQLYRLSQSSYRGKNTVPVLWDKQTKTIVNNESADIILLLNSEFNQYAKNPNLNLYPSSLVRQIDQWNEKIYHNVNNGVYRCGFAQTQEAYELACRSLFETLAQIEIHLASNRYLCGDSFTLADVRLFTTLIRFDMVYYPLFKCSLNAIASYPHLSRYVEDINNLPNIKNTYDLNAIKQDYYGNLFPLNPSGIIPL